jgi:hypothetical protein
MMEEKEVTTSIRGIITTGEREKMTAVIGEREITMAKEIIIMTKTTTIIGEKATGRIIAVGEITTITINGEKVITTVKTILVNGGTIIRKGKTIVNGEAIKIVINGEKMGKINGGTIKMAKTNHGEKMAITMVIKVGQTAMEGRAHEGMILPKGTRAGSQW